MRAVAAKRSGRAAPRPEEIEASSRGLIRLVIRRQRAKGQRFSEDDDDLVQEVLVALYESLGRYDPAVAAWSTFVGVIAYRRVARLAQRPDPLRCAVSLSRPTLGDATVGEGLPDVSAPDPVRVAEAGERAEVLREVRVEMSRLVALLEERGRFLEVAVVEALAEADGDHRAAARALGLPRAEVERAVARVRTYAPARALERLRERL